MSVRSAIIVSFVMVTTTTGSSLLACSSTCFIAAVTCAHGMRDRCPDAGYRGASACVGCACLRFLGGFNLACRMADNCVGTVATGSFAPEF